jgi:putative ABC transport system ATP-binding protein
MRQRCHQEGTAFLIATHDSRLTRRCDRVIELHDGQITAGLTDDSVPHDDTLPRSAA